MPADFTAYPPNATPGRDETGAPTGQAIVLQNQKVTSLQIVVTPTDEASPDNTFTAPIWRGRPTLILQTRNLCNSLPA
jgi:hypothetical protein